MRFNRILLVNSFMNTSNTGMLRPHAGLGYIAQALDDVGLEYEVVDMGCVNGFSHLKKKIEFLKPDLLAISAMSFGYKSLYKMITEIKKIYNNKIQVVLGGAHISTFNKEALINCEGIDYGIVSEGEFSFLELVKGKELSSINGLIWREGGEIIFNESKNFIDNLDSVSFPKYRKFDLSSYITEEMPLVTSRGCPYQCTFCASEVAGKVYRARSPVSVVDEIEYWLRNGRRSFDILDDNFSLIQKRVYDICDEIERRDLKGIAIRIGSGVRADRLDRTLLSRLKKVGVNHISIGVESASDNVLYSLNKQAKLSIIEESIKAACDINLDTTLFFLIGSPNETWKDFLKSLTLARKYPVFEARFHNLVPFPGTKLFNWVSEHNYFIRKPEDYLNSVSQWINEPVFETPEFTKKERKLALKLAHKVRKTIIYNALKRKLRILPFLNIIIALFLSSDTGQQLYYFNKSFRKIVDKFRRVIIYLNSKQI